MRFNEKKIEYIYGDLLGTNNHKFIREIEREIRDRGSNSKYKASYRRGEFECGLCGNKFTNKISLIKNDLVLSCGCLKIQKVKAYHESKRKDDEKDNNIR